MNRKLSIVIPCLNEEKAIDQVLNRIYTSMPAFRLSHIQELEVIVVDDASTDQSPAVLARWEQSNGLVTIRNSERQNYGGALKIGFQKATGDLIGFMDMDGTYPPEEYAPMIAALDQYQASIVCGNRLARHSGMPWSRSIGNRFYVALINFLYGQRIHDGCTGQRVFRRELIQEFCDLPATRLNFSLAMTLHCLVSKHRLIELPIRYDERIGSSKLSLLTDGPRFLLTILIASLCRGASRSESKALLSDTQVKI